MPGYRIVYFRNGSTHSKDVEAATYRVETGSGFGNRAISLLSDDEKVIGTFFDVDNILERNPIKPKSLPSNVATDLDDLMLNNPPDENAQP